MYCGYCGKKNSDQMLFCVFCGKPLEAPEQTEDADDRRRRYGPPARHGANRQMAGDRPSAAPERVGKTARPDFSREGAGEEALPQAEDIVEASVAPEEVPDLPLAPAIKIKAVYHARRRPKHAPKEREAEPFRTPGEPILKAPLKMRAQHPPDLKRDLLQEEIPEPLDIPRPDPLPKPILSRPVELTGMRPPRLRRTDAPVRPANASNGRQANTLIPRHEQETQDLFFESEAYDDDFDAPEPVSDGYLYEEPERQSFFYRHIRGIVALILLALTIAIVGYWLGFGSGQRVLGQLYLTSNPQTYLSLGNEANARGAYEEAGAYYLKALELSPSVETAIMASNAYVQANNLGKAASALETLLSISPDYTEAYVTLKTFYPDPSTRPARVTELIRQGYLRTGDDRLREGE